MTIQHRPIPELLDRKDFNLNEGSGGWNVSACDAARGKPFTNLIDRHMAVPMMDAEYARLIRAHEMMHARLSPPSWDPWIKREVASYRGLQGAEELRINYLLSQVGFDTKALTDNSEARLGETVARAGDWAEAVYFLAAVVCTGGFNGYITGIRRIIPDWADTLRALGRHLEKLAKDNLHGKKRRYGVILMNSTIPLHGMGMPDEVADHPSGFLWTEKIAEMLDRIAKTPDTQNQNNGGDKGDKGDKGDTSQKDTQKNKTTNAPIDPKTISKIKPQTREPSKIREPWRELIIKELPLTKPAPGGLGTRRTVTNRGKNPRYLHRYLTDPQRRIFENTLRAKGGIVVFDLSGSMHLEQEDVAGVLNAAPGTIVLGYRVEEANPKLPNAWIMAARGRMAEITRFEGSGSNGPDLPALQWAVSQRKRHNDPIIWVTDGKVHGGGLVHGSTLMTLECMQYVIANNIICAENPEQAIGILNQAKTNPRPKWAWPYYMRQVWTKNYGGMNPPTT